MPSRSFQIRAPFPERELGFTIKIVHNFLPYVPVYHSMTDKNLQIFQAFIIIERKSSYLPFFVGIGYTHIKENSENINLRKRNIYEVIG